MQLRLVRSWIVSPRTILRPTAPLLSELLNLKSQNVASKIHLERTITTNQNIQAVEQIVMRDWQISLRRVAYKLSIPTTTTVYEIMSNHLGMKKVSTR